MFKPMPRGVYLVLNVCYFLFSQEMELNQFVKPVHIGIFSQPNWVSWALDNFYL